MLKIFEVRDFVLNLMNPFYLQQLMLLLQSSRRIHAEQLEVVGQMFSMFGNFTFKQLQCTDEYLFA